MAAELDGEGFWWTIGSSGANCGVSAGGAAVEARFDGGLELTGVQVERRQRSELRDWGNGKRTRGEAFWGICSAAAREKSRAEVLLRARHRGSEVVTVWACRGGVAKRGGHQREEGGR